MSEQSKLRASGNSELQRPHGGSGIQLVGVPTVELLPKPRRRKPEEQALEALNLLALPLTLPVEHLAAAVRALVELKTKPQLKNRFRSTIK